jgi:hypothetical protein
MDGVLTKGEGSGEGEGSSSCETDRPITKPEAGRFVLVAEKVDDTNELNSLELRERGARKPFILLAIAKACSSNSGGGGYVTNI